jgi:predicted Zn-dependent protease with MMP-like domain
MPMTLNKFSDLVDQALEDLPDQFKSALSNVQILVEVWPSRADLAELKIHGWLFGLYRGVPQTRRANYTSVLPDKIIIFAGPILSVYGSDPQVVKRQVRSTVLHEIGHHFGMSEEEIQSAMK